MRRRLAVLPVLVLGLLLVAVPAIAASEESEKVEEFGMWDGLIYATIAAVVMGLVAFFDAYAGASDDGHADHH